MMLLLIVVISLCEEDETSFKLMNFGTKSVNTVSMVRNTPNPAVPCTALVHSPHPYIRYRFSIIAGLNTLLYTSQVVIIAVFHMPTEASSMPQPSQTVCVGRDPKGRYNHTTAAVHHERKARKTCLQQHNI